MIIRCLGCMETFENTYQMCPHCGYVVGTKAEEAIHLAPGSLLQGRYTIGRVLGYGGFGVTYLAWDSRLEQKVAIKEYLPSEFSTRMPGQSRLSVFSGDKAEQFHDGLVKFLEESKRLAKFQNEPGIVTVFDSFEENNTAYLVMEYLEGETLTELLKREGTLDEDQAVALLLPLMESLEHVHEAGLLHRDIAPDNIFITTDGRAKLIDFGAARFATTSHSRSLTVIIKQGYSPEEQYRSRGDQGPYTDVYALGAMLYKMITGTTPPDAMERRARYENQNQDILTEPHKLNRKISRNREVAILNAMNVRIEDRTPNVETFIKELQADPPAKRIYGKIKKLDFYAWPLWLKLVLPAAGALLLSFAALLLTGVIDLSSPYSDEIILPENVVKVPQVEGLSSAEAIKMIEESRLLVVSGGNIQSEYVPAGLIILQSPASGTYASVNAGVILTVSAGTGVIPPFNGVATVPYLIWDTQEAAAEKLAQAGLGQAKITEEYDENVAEGQVISQSAEAGASLPEGGQMTLTISKGPAPFALENVTGLEEAAAKELLEGKGLIVLTAYEHDSSVPEGQVLAQSTEEGEEVKKGDTITLTVSSGKPTFEVADVTGKEKEEAESLLTEQGFEVILLENYDSEVPAGSIISQTPEAGSTQIEGTRITLYVSKGKHTVVLSFNANGGSVSEADRSLEAGAAYGALPAPTRSGYTFDGWYSAAEGGTKAEEKMTIGTADVTLYAHWTQVPPATLPVAQETTAPATQPSQRDQTMARTTQQVTTVPTQPATTQPTTAKPTQSSTTAPTTTTAPTNTTAAPTTPAPTTTTVAPTTPAPTTTAPEEVSVQVGTYIIFGSYEQDNNTAHGKEPIEWLVLAKDGNKVLVISRYVLDCQPFNSTGESLIWRDCTLRQWLNSNFLNNAFSAEQIKSIQLTRVGPSETWGLSDNNESNDYLFILNVEEATHYFASMDASCLATDYAIKRGVSLYSGMFVTDYYLRNKAIDNHTGSPSLSGALTVRTDNLGVHFGYGASSNSKNIGIRPVMWIIYGS